MMMTPMMIKPAPTQERMLGTSMVMRLCTPKASTSSTHLRLDTRLGDTSCSDLVRVVKASNPDSDKPEKPIRHLKRRNYLVSN